MENIYTNFNKNRTKNYKKKKTVDFSKCLLLSFALIITLVMVGFGQISFSDSNVETIPGLPIEFVTKAVDKNNLVLGSKSSFLVNRFETQDNEFVYCLESDIDYLPDIKYKKDIEINDAGLIYLMSNLYPNKKILDGGKEIDERAAVWLSQTAIWIYLAETNVPNNTRAMEAASKIRAENILYPKAEIDAGNDDLEFITIITSVEEGSNKTLYQKFGIDTLIENAKKLKNTKKNDIEIKSKTDNIILSEDKKFYKTDLISVNSVVADSSISTFKEFNLNIKEVPEGTKIYDKDNKEITNLKGLQAGTNFYLVIPVDKVTEESKSLKLEIEGLFNGLTAYRYISESKAEQKLAGIGVQDEVLKKGLDLEINYTPEVPDTIDSNSKTIIFAGIIILISGIGMFCLNAKKN